jgi:hypothetical protein
MLNYTNCLRRRHWRSRRLAPGAIAGIALEERRPQPLANSAPDPVERWQISLVVVHLICADLGNSRATGFRLEDLAKRLYGEIPARTTHLRPSASRRYREHHIPCSKNRGYREVRLRRAKLLHLREWHAIQRRRHHGCHQNATRGRQALRRARDRTRHPQRQYRADR